MKRYMLTVFQPNGDPPPPEVLGPVFSELEVINQEMHEKGAWLFSARLHSPETATVVRYRDDDFLLTDGPYVEGKEHIGGFALIQARDLDVAVEWAGRLARATGLPIEVRPVHE